MYLTTLRGYVSDSEHNGKSASSYLIETTETDSESNREFNPVFVEIIPTEIDGIGTPPYISIGTNSPNYDNIVGNLQLGGLLLTQLLPLESPMASIGEGVGIYAKVNSVALIYDAYKFKVALLGYETNS